MRGAVFQLHWTRISNATPRMTPRITRADVRITIPCLLALLAAVATAAPPKDDGYRGIW